MKNSVLLKTITLFIFGSVTILLCTNASAWQHEVAIGYGSGQQDGDNYDSTIALINAKLYKFKKIDNTLIATIDATISQLHANAPEPKNSWDLPVNNDLTASAISLAFRAYFLHPEQHTIRPYVGAAVGPAYLTAREFGTRQQGSNFAIRTALEGGVEIGSQQRSFDIGIQMNHYCNAGIFPPNQGYTFPLILTIGYQF